MGTAGANIIVNAIDTAIAEQAPVIGIWHSGWRTPCRGRRSATPSVASSRAMVRASGYVLQIPSSSVSLVAALPTGRRSPTSSSWPRRAGIRHRTRRRQECHRRGCRHGGVPGGPLTTERSPAVRHIVADLNLTLTERAAFGVHLQPPGQLQPRAQLPPFMTLTCARCCPNLRAPRL